MERFWVALEVRAELIATWDNWLERDSADLGVIRQVAEHEEDTEEDNRMHDLRCMVHLEEAETFYVASDMCGLLELAYQEMPDEPLLQTDLLEPHGFVYFDRPMRLGPEEHDYVNAICWHTGGGGLDSVHYRRSYGGWKWTSIDDDWWPWGVTVAQVLEDNPNSEVENLRLLKCFFVLSGSRVVLDESQMVWNRAVRRRLVRMGQPARPVRVITLRRPVRREADADGIPVDWTHRWIVSGHWRNQWMPSIGAHRQMWIHPYLKGPDDKPLVVKNKLYRWIR